MKKSLVINLYGGPGTGKSTICAELFSMLKWRGVNCEMALEFAKDKVWEESFKVLENQIYIFGKQLHRLHRLNGKVDVILTDAPLLFSLIYDKSKSDAFKMVVLEQYKLFNNSNFLLKRHKPYKTEGRMQNEKGAKALDVDISLMLQSHGIQHYSLPAKQENVQEIFDQVLIDLNVEEYIDSMTKKHAKP